jgi:hypothetical protein
MAQIRTLVMGFVYRVFNNFDLFYFDNSDIDIDFTSKQIPFLMFEIILLCNFMDLYITVDYCFERI